MKFKSTKGMASSRLRDLDHLTLLLLSAPLPVLLNSANIAVLHLHSSNTLVKIIENLVVLILISIPSPLWLVPVTPSARSYHISDPAVWVNCCWIFTPSSSQVDFSSSNDCAVYKGESCAIVRWFHAMSCNCSWSCRYWFNDTSLVQHSNFKYQNHTEIPNIWIEAITVISIIKMIKINPFTW